MINAVQIRSARALLDWTTAELAQRANMAVNAINRIERGKSTPQRGTLDKLEEIFESEGVEFLPNSGLRKKDNKISIYEGEDFKKKLIKDIAATLKKTSGELLMAHEEDSGIISKINTELTKQKPSKPRKADAGYKYFARDNDRISHSWGQCHIIPHNFFSSYPLYIYGSKLALSTREFSPKTIVIDSDPIAASLRRMFDYVWDNTLDAASYRMLEKKTSQKRNK